MPYSDPDRQREYQRNWRAARREVAVLTDGARCSRCGERRQGLLEFDHVDPASKKLDVAIAWSRRASVRDAELAKCQLLCRSCHQAKSVAEATRADVPHPSQMSYKRGCRCAECRLLRASYERERRAALRRRRSVQR